MRGYTVAKSIGALRNYIRGRYANCRGETCLYLPTRGIVRKRKPTKAEAISQAVQRIRAKTLSSQEKRDNEKFSSGCKCYRLYFPELWPTANTYNCLPPEQFGALLRIGMKLELPGDLDRYYSALLLTRLAPQQYLERAHNYRIKSYSMKYGGLYTLKKDYGSQAYSVVSHMLHLDVERYEVLWQRFADSALESIDREWSMW
jgi:hypothetical protein